MAPWPRRLTNYPIIIACIAYQYIEAGCLVWNPAAGNATAVHALVLVFPPAIAAYIIGAAATLVVIGFREDREKITTLLCLVPQQLLLYIGAGGAAEAIWASQFADGVLRPQAFLMVDQCPPILLAVCHSWSLMLILRYAKNGGL